MLALSDPLLRWQLLRRLTRAAEWPGQTPGRHSQRVGRLASRLALEMGLESIDAAMIGAAARFHDVGNIAIAPDVLFSPAPLSPEDVRVVRRHVELGAELLAGDSSSLLVLARTIVLTHHERWDGCGYPDGRSGASIHIAGRIVAVADAWDVMTHERPYQAARGPAAALNEIRTHAGTQFDPDVVEALVRVMVASTHRSLVPASRKALRLM